MSAAKASKRVEKKQKGFQLPDDVITWINEEELRTGASLSRIALAAFCSLINKSEADRTWDMRAAVWVERGDCAFKDVPLIQLEQAVVGFEHLLKSAKTADDKDECKRGLEKAKRQLDEFRKTGKVSV